MSDEKRTKATERAEYTFTDLDEWKGAVNMFHQDVDIVPDGEFYTFAFEKKDRKKVAMFNKATEWGYVNDPKSD
jgi:hypothetical protein